MADQTPIEQPGSSISLNRLWKVVQRRRRPFLLAFGVVTLLSFGKSLISEFTNPQYDGQFTLLISDPVSSANNRGGQESGGAIESLARNSRSNDVPTLIQVLQSSSVLEPVYVRMRQEGFKEIPSPQIQLASVNTGNQGTVGNVVASGVLKIGSNGGDQRALVRMLELTQQAYLDWSLSQRRLQLSEGLKFLDQQEPVLRARNASLQSELRGFRQRNNVLSPEDDAKAINTKMLEVQAKLLELESARQQLLDIRRDVQQGRLTARSFNLGSGQSTGNASSGSGAGLSAGLPSQGLLDEWQRLENAIGAARGLYQPDSAVLLGLIASQQRLRPALTAKQLDAVEAALQQNQDNSRSTREQLQKLQIQFRRQPQLLNDYQALEQRINIAATNLDNYLKTRDQFQLEIAQNTSPWQVISSTTVQRSSSGTSLGKGFIQALVLGTFAGMGAAVLKDRLDHVYHSPQEVETDLNQPLLAHMPYVAQFEGVRRDQRMLLTDIETKIPDVDRYQRFYYQEALRNLYTSLRFLQSDVQLRSLAFTSSTPSEGKSLVTILFARILSELGIRVLVVDADLRKPQLHHRLGLDNLRGLSNLITEQDTHWSEVVQKAGGEAKFDAITSGRRSPNPPRLLSSERMQQLVKDIAASGRYDMVIYDAPPVLGLADAALLAEQLDGVMLLVGLSKVDRSLPEQAMKRLLSSRAKVLGIVTNARRPRGEVAGAYAYTYGRARQEPGLAAYQGYGALDPAATYAYYEYTQSSGEEREASIHSRSIRKRSAIHQLQKMAARLNRWLDGA